MGTIKYKPQPVTWSTTDKGSNVTLSDNNLTATHSTGNVNGNVRATKGVSSGKWYWEIKWTVGTNGVLIGIASSDVPLDGDPENDNRSLMYLSSLGWVMPVGTNGTAYVLNDIIGIALDMDDPNGRIDFYKNGVIQGNNSNIKTNITTAYPFLSTPYLTNSHSWTANFGATPFAYPIPEGYSPLDNTIPFNFSNLSPWAKMRRCNLSDSGKVNAYFGDPTFKDDGSNGQVMVEIPKFWYKKIPNETGYDFAISDRAEVGFTLHPAFFRDRDGDGIAEEVDYRYFSAYEGVLHDGTNYVTGNTTADNNASVIESWKLCSVSGYKPYAGLTIGNFRTIAERRGNGWGILDFNLLYAIQMLYVTEYGHFDSQSKIGMGFVTGNSASCTTGRTAFLGNQTGNEANNGTDGTYAMSYRGIENLYGNVFKWIDGLVSGTNQIKIGNVNFNDTGSGYTVYDATFSNASGYISDIWSESEFGFIGKTFSGSNTSKLYAYGNLYAGYLPLFGGDWTAGLAAGAFRLHVFNSASNSGSSISARLAL